MKKAAFTTKLVCVALLFLIGLVLTTKGIFSGIAPDYCGSGYTGYKTYEGDAYTGIQNAAVDTANNVELLGYFIEDVVEQSCIYIGLACLALAAYLLGCTLASVDKKKVAKSGTPLDTIAKYKSLLDSEAISKEEFETLKKQLLDL